MRLHLLHNPKSGGIRATKRGRRLAEELTSSGHSVVDLTGDSASSSSNALRQAIDNDEIEHLVIVGGDGLVHLALQRVAGTAIPVTLAPSGTGNDFATALGISANAPLAVGSPTTAIDLIDVTNAAGSSVVVASIAIAGFPASINKRANNMRLPLGSQVYAAAAALELRSFERLELALRLDNHPFVTDTAMLAIGNTKLFGGGMLACPDARPTDGLLHLTSIQGVGRLGILRHLIGRSGGTADRPEVLRRSAIQIAIDTPGVDLWGDGEPLLTTPATLTIRPAAVQLTSVVKD